MRCFFKFNMFQILNDISYSKITLEHSFKFQVMFQHLIAAVVKAYEIKNY